MDANKYFDSLSVYAYVCLSRCLSARMSQLETTSKLHEMFCRPTC